MQYLVALERPWPTRSPAASPRGAGPSWYSRSRAGARCSTWSPWSALGQPDHRRPPPGGPGLPGTRDPGRVPGAVPGRPGAPLATPITGGRLERARPAGTRDPGRVPGAVPGRPGAPLANPSSGGRPQGAGPAGTRDPGRVPGAVPGRPGAPLANPITGGRLERAGPAWYSRSRAGAR